MFLYRLVGLVIVLCGLFGCAAPEIPKSHNDPNKYIVAEDVLWGSPDGFDLTMDIYLHRSSIAIFFGIPFSVFVFYCNFLFPLIFLYLPYD